MKKRPNATFPAIGVLDKRGNQSSTSIFLTPKYTRVETGISDRSACEVDHPPDPGDPPAIYRMTKVTRLTGLSRSSIYRLEALDQFPKRVKLGASAVGWRNNDIHSWIASRKVAITKVEK